MFKKKPKVKYSVALVLAFLAAEKEKLISAMHAKDMEARAVPTAKSKTPAKTSDNYGLPHQRIE